MKRRDISRFIKHLPTNSIGRDFVVGDLHGCIVDLLECLKQIGFNTAKDRLFCTGDMINRGPHSKETVELIYEDWCYSVRGNHDEMMIQGILNNDRDMTNCWNHNGGNWRFNYTEMTIKDLARDMDDLMPYCIVVGEGADRFNIVHAEVYHQDIINMHPERIMVTDEFIDEWGFDTDEMDNMLWSWRLSDSIKQKIFPFEHVRCHDPEKMSITYVGHKPMPMPVQIERQIYLDGGGVYHHYGSEMKDHTNCLLIAEPYAQVIHRYSMLHGTITQIPYSEIEKFHQ